MKTNYIGHQIEQFLRDSHTVDQISAIVDLPIEQITDLYNEHLKQQTVLKTKASNQHSQATYAMSLQG